MSTRVHTAYASSIHVACPTEANLIDGFGEEFEGLGECLVLEDAGNCEALVITGSAAQLKALAEVIMRQVAYVGPASPGTFADAVVQVAAAYSDGRIVHAIKALRDWCGEHKHSMVGIREGRALIEAEWERVGA